LYSGVVWVWFRLVFLAMSSFAVLFGVWSLFCCLSISTGCACDLLTCRKPLRVSHTRRHPLLCLASAPLFPPCPHVHIAIRSLAQTYQQSRLDRLVCAHSELFVVRLPLLDNDLTDLQAHVRVVLATKSMNNATTLNRNTAAWKNAVCDVVMEDQKFPSKTLAVAAAKSWVLSTRRPMVRKQGKGWSR
jgi:hypothetical protein